MPEDDMKSVNLDNVKFARRSPRGSKYAKLFKRLEKLKPEKAVLVKQDPDEDIQARRNAIALAVRKKLDPPKGYKWSFATTKEYEVVIFLAEV